MAFIPGTACLRSACRLGTWCPNLSQLCIEAQPATPAGLVIILEHVGYNMISQYSPFLPSHFICLCLLAELLPLIVVSRARHRDIQHVFHFSLNFFGRKVVDVIGRVIQLEENVVQDYKCLNRPIELLHITSWHEFKCWEAPFETAKIVFGTDAHARML